MTQHYTLTIFTRDVLTNEDSEGKTLHAPDLSGLADHVVEAQEALPSVYNSVETRRRFRAWLQEMWQDGLDVSQASLLYIECVGQPMMTFLAERHANISELAAV